MLNVLVFPSGMENGIEILNSLKNCKEIKLFSATANVPNQAFYLYVDNILMPDVRTDEWLDDLNKAVEKYRIDLIYPANSLVIDALSRNRDKIKTDILLPDTDVLETTRSKKKTLNVLKGIIPIPEIYEKKEEVSVFPVFAKPDNGYGAQGACVIHNSAELSEIDFQHYIVQELLPGAEYTVDCLSDNDGNLLFCSGRERSRIRMATSMHAQDVSEELQSLFEKYAKAILSRIKIKGAWFFQVKKDKSDQFKLLEIDVRIAGTMCYDRCKGINFPLLSIYLHRNKPVEVLTNNISFSLDRCLKNRYIFNYEYETVYIDLDDTIIFRGKINTDVVKFLYQCLNQNKKIVLLSKNLQKDRNGYLKKYRLYDIFDEIHWLQEEASKADYIKEKKAIYIDDSFSQRKEVAEKCKIPVFDVSMLEVLFDDRI